MSVCAALTELTPQARRKCTFQPNHNTRQASGARGALFKECKFKLCQYVENFLGSDADLMAGTQPPPLEHRLGPSLSLEGRASFPSLGVYVLNLLLYKNIDIAAFAGSGIPPTSNGRGPQPSSFCIRSLSNHAVGWILRARRLPTAFFHRQRRGPGRVQSSD